MTIIKREATLPGVTGIGDGTSSIAQAGEQSSRGEAQVGISEFNQHVQETNQDLGTLRTGQTGLRTDVDNQGTRLGQAEQTVRQHTQGLTDQGRRLGGLENRSDSLETTTGQLGGRLAGHDTRLTNLEAGQQHDATPLQTADVTTNQTHIDNLRSVRNNDLHDVGTGHNSIRASIKNSPRQFANAFRGADNKKELSHTAPQDDVLKERIRNDPMVRLQQSKLDGAITRMEQANQAGAGGSRVEFMKAAEEAESAAKELDSARKSIESTSVFQSSNRFSKHTTAVNGTIAALSLAGAGTTGGIIAWNNKKQGDKA